jgi:hypothetical protein
LATRRALAFALTLVANTASAQTSDVAVGIEAIARRDVRGAEAAFRRGTTAANPLIHAAAWQWLGHVSWKYRGDTTAAKRYLDRALIEARDSSQILLEIARLNGYRGRYQEAIRVGREAMSRSLDAERRGAAARTLADLIVDGFLAPRSSPFRPDSHTVAELRDTLASRVARFRGRTNDALALIKVGTVMRDSLSVSAGLDSYFAMVDPALEQRSAAYAAVLMRELSPDDPYGRFLRDTRRGIEDVYQNEIRRLARPGDVRRLLNRSLQSLWRATDWKQPDFIPSAVTRESARRFGTVISVERGRDVDELFLAHRLGTYSVNGAPVVVLDGVVSSGIDDWLLDGTGGRAGWVSNDTIYERRTGFTETPFRALLALTDPQTIPGELFRISRDSIGDIERAREDSLGYLPGVATRIFHAGAQVLLDSLKSPDAFTRAMYDQLVRTTIHLHEGRHLADARGRPRQSAADAEFRAKLDEVTGAALPRLALTAILSPNIGDSSPHGQANRRIMIGLDRWIRRNGNTIAGYDRRMPALLQLPQLTDAQLKAAFNSMRVP